jgi:hypothetical protein
LLERYLGRSLSLVARNGFTLSDMLAYIATNQPHRYVSLLTRSTSWDTIQFSESRSNGAMFSGTETP